MLQKLLPNLTPNGLPEPLPNWGATPNYRPGLTRHKPRIEYKPMLSDVKLPNKFDLNRAIELMQLSIFAYDQFNYFNTQGNGSVDGWSPNDASYSVMKTLYTYQKIDKVIKKVPIGFIAKKDNLSSVPDFFVCWRGTITGNEWASDLDFYRIKCSFLKNGEKVHRGFQNIYTGGDDDLGESPRKVVLDYLDTINKTTPDYNLWITGHSLGAALAVLNICDIVVNNYNKNAKMYNFAGPKVGNSAFATTFEKYIGTNCSSWRVVNTSDEVPRSPPSKIGFVKSGYVHVNGCNNANSFNGLFEITNIKAPHSAATYLSTLNKFRSI